jgi:hypothetical protein
MATDLRIRSTQQTSEGSDLSSGARPGAPWMEDVSLHFFVDAEHSPVLIRLTGTLNQDTAANVVPVVGELIAQGDRDFELQTPGLCVPDGGGTKALTGIQRLVRRSGGHVTWDTATMDSHDRHTDRLSDVPGESGTPGRGSCFPTSS